MFGLKGKIALVTGGASGIGRATVMKFLSEDAKVVIADIQDEIGNEILKNAKEAGKQAVFVKCDVSKKAEVEALVKKCIDIYGRLDCAVNCAGILGEMGKLQDCTEDNFDRIMTVNVKGMWLCMKYEIIQMLKQNSGTIVSIASNAGARGTPDLPVYGASKAAVSLLVRSAAIDLVSKNIRVNGINPGYIQTPMVEKQEKYYPEKVKEYKEAQRMKRMGEPEEIAAAAVWLCSDEASFVAGHMMNVDGASLA